MNSKKLTLHCVIDVSWDGRLPIRIKGLMLIPYLVTIGYCNGGKVASIYRQLKDIRGMGDKKLLVDKDIDMERYLEIQKQYNLPIIESYLKSQQCEMMVEIMVEKGGESER